MIKYQIDITLSEICIAGVFIFCVWMLINFFNMIIHDHWGEEVEVEKEINENLEKPWDDPGFIRDMRLCDEKDEEDDDS